MALTSFSGVATIRTVFPEEFLRSGLWPVRVGTLAGFLVFQRSTPRPPFWFRVTNDALRKLTEMKLFRCGLFLFKLDALCKFCA